MSVATVPGGNIKPAWELREIPEAPDLDLRGLLQWSGPAVILGALSVGGFEAYNAGYAAARQFAGIFWIYLVSCFFQLFMNREIARYTMATGETVLQGFTRLPPAKFWGPFTALFCLVQQGWPAWIGGAMAGLAFLLGGVPQIYGMVGIGLVFLLFAASKYVYNTLEWIMYAAFIVANFGLVFMTIAMTNSAAVGAVTAGWFAFGTIPAGITFSIVGPFFNQPAGGFWNFWQTYWIREKGMGMGQYMGKMTGLVTKEEEIRRLGFMFNADDPVQIKRFQGWMRLNMTNLLLFFILIGGILFTYFAAIAGYSAATIYGMEVPSGARISIVLADIFGSAFGQIGFGLFAMVLIFALFDSQFSVNDGIARMVGEATMLEGPEGWRRMGYRAWYFGALGFITLVGMWAVWQATPYFIWVATNWLGNFVHAWLTVMLVWMNMTLLPKPIRPEWWANVANIIWAIVVMTYFLAWTFIGGGPQP
ncbi:MAG: Nramp family divalent metal transporter [Chloroflexota bacterium]